MWWWLLQFGVQLCLEEVVALKQWAWIVFVGQLLGHSVLLRLLEEFPVTSETALDRNSTNTK